MQSYRPFNTISKGVEYNGQFSAYAADNEIQDGDVAEDLACGFEQR